MNFDLTEEQQLLADSLKRYLANEYSIRHAGEDRGFGERVERDGVGCVRGDGPARACRSPRSTAASAGTAVDVMLVMEAIGEGLVVEPYWRTWAWAGGWWRGAGREAQQKRILPGLIQGKQRLAFAHTERGARYDLAQVG